MGSGGEVGYERQGSDLVEVYCHEACCEESEDGTEGKGEEEGPGKDEAEVLEDWVWLQLRGIWLWHVLFADCVWNRAEVCFLSGLRTAMGAEEVGCTSTGVHRTCILRLCCRDYASAEARVGDLEKICVRIGLRRIAAQ